MFYKEQSKEIQSYIKGDITKEIILPVYKIDSCVFDILKPIVDNDTNCAYFTKNNTGYSFSVNEINGGGYSIGIRPVKLDKIESANYFGIFEFGQRKFLCWGQKPSELFHTVTSDSITIQFCRKEDLSLSDFYLGGDVPSTKKLINCKNKKFYFIITANCDSNLKKKKRKIH